MFPPRIPPAVCKSERSLVFAISTADTAVCAVGTMFSTTAFPFVIKLSFCSESMFVRSAFSGIEGRALRCTVRKSWEIFWASSVVDCAAAFKPVCMCVCGGSVDRVGQIETLSI